MKTIKRYLPLHLNILLFSFTGVFSKAASNCYNREGLLSVGLCVFLGLMLLNCFLYAIAWQRVIKRFDLNVAYANRSVYLIWSQVWAVLIFKERLTLQNVLGLFIVFCGVLVVQHSEYAAEGKAP